MSDIFISYASSDRDAARRLVEALKAQDWSIWWDREILPGRRYDDVIEEAISNAKCVLVARSNTLFGSRWFPTASRARCVFPRFLGVLHRN